MNQVSNSFFENEGSHIIFESGPNGQLLYEMQVINVLINATLVKSHRIYHFSLLLISRQFSNLINFSILEISR